MGTEAEGSEAGSVWLYLKACNTVCAGSLPNGADLTANDGFSLMDTNVSDTTISLIGLSIILLHV